VTAEADLVAGEVGLDEVHGRRADEGGDEQVGRAVEELLRRVALLQHAVAQDGDPRAERHRLDLVVGDVDRRDPQALVQLGQLRAHRDAQLGVEVGQRLVHQERRRLAHDGPAHGDALALPARQRAGPALEQLGESEHVGDLGDAALARGPVDPPQAQAEAEVAAHGQVRIQRVVLEDHRDVALARLEAGHVALADVHGAGRRLLDARDEPQQRRLAAARRAYEDHELAVVDLERHVVDGARAVAKRLGQFGQSDAAHGFTSSA
jgi:hypothetical protein